ncbi:unnamed protein product [Leptidea sinapis]|uniref:C2H2-type domain-containing protein n=1 Tax=Leptidea sinapis TaxID=189913 RepID=A0A5E4Q999_9NEOP|nr:unnamed protein product [Leptidea sinapis]
METRREALCGFNVCRFCLSPAGPLLNLYDKNQISKESTNLKLKILTCLSIEIFPSDKMPQYICARCKYFMTTFYEFKKICRQADEIILNYLQRGTPLRTMPYPRVLQKLFKNSTHIKTMKTVVEGSTVQVSSQDTSDTEDEDGNVYNVKINGPDDENNTACIKVVTSAEPEIPKGTRKGFSSVSKLTRHIRSHAGDRPYPCKFCEKSFTKSQHYTRHLRVVHRKNSTAASEVEAESYRCEECEETFTSQDDLIFHSAVHATQNLTCPLCQEKFATVDDVTAHIKSHVNGLEFMCDFCELVFTSKEKLDNHIASAHEEEFQNEMDQTQEDSMDADPEDDEDDTGIRVKEDGDNMVIEINKAHDFMMPEDQDDNEDRNDNTYSEDSEVDATFIDMQLTEGSPVKKVSIIVPENTSPAVASEMKIIPAQNRVRKQMKTMSPNVTASAAQTKIAEAVSTPAKDQASLLPSKLDAKVNEQAPHIIRKAEEVKRKALPQVEPSSAKKVIAKAESNNASDKSLRLLEKELQDLKRTNSRTEASKTPQSKPTEMLKGKQRSQIITSTPKTRLTEEKKSQLSSKPVAIEKKQVERRVTKENKEPKDNSEEINRSKRRTSIKPKVQNSATTTATPGSTPGARKRGRPRKERKEIPKKAKKTDEESEKEQEEADKTLNKEGGAAEMLDDGVNGSQVRCPGSSSSSSLNNLLGLLEQSLSRLLSPSKAYPDDNPEKPASTLLKSPLYRRGSKPNHCLPVPDRQLDQSKSARCTSAKSL